MAVFGLCLMAACFAPADDFPDFYLVNTCNVTVEASSPGFAGPFTLLPGETHHLYVGTEGESVTFELRVNVVAYDSVTGVSPLRIASCPPT